MRLPYECQTSALPAQRHITQFLQFLGASDVEFAVDAALACSVRWRVHGKEESLGMSAQGYVKQWMRSRAWKRPGCGLAPLPGSQERDLAVANFWYVLRDEVLAQAAEKIFNHDRLFKSAGLQTHRLLQQLRRGDGA